MSSKLYVGNIPFGVSDAQLGDHFAQAGSVVSAAIIMDRMSGRSKGFGFVEMSSPEDAQKAISMFNEVEFQGRKLIVNVAQPREERPRREGGFGGGRRDGGGFRGDRGDRGPRRW